MTGRLAGHFAHEFNNLLTVISGNLELIELSGDLAGSQELIEDARSAAAKGAQVIRDMMAFSQRTHLEPKRTNLNAVLSAFCGRAEQILNISIKPVLADSLWAVSVDQSGFENSVLSLVVNAKEAMQDGGCITVFTDNITHSLGHDDLLALELLPGRYVRVTVADTGIGIPKERLSQIFDPFYSSKGLGVGMGLGLSAVFGFVKKSGGVVTVVSEVGRGSRFMLYFPAASDSGGA